MPSCSLINEIEWESHKSGLSGRFVSKTIILARGVVFLVSRCGNLNSTFSLSETVYFNDDVAYSLCQLSFW